MLKVTNDLILTAGPSITFKEAEYVLDAALRGWNHHHSDYIRKFEQSFAEYLGVKYAMTTSSCTGALHLALLSLGIGPGDEVIVPETTWIATASAVVYVGAKPVFADIEPDTWVLAPESVKKLISPWTKVIIPVHLYGHPVDMEPIYDLVADREIIILEDAAPSIGSEYKGKKTGNLGKAAAFSFQGAKALVTGEGGIFVTNDEKLMERARFLGDHGRDPQKTLYNIEIGYKYKMSNLQAAFGLAQLEQIEDIVSKKRQIFKWYKDRLSDINEIILNAEHSWARNIFWMSSIVLGDSIKISRDEFIQRLRERNIDSRPFFYPISSFPMFRGIKVDNPIAYSIPLRGINLPSGHERTEEEIDYICAHIKDILGRKLNRASSCQPQGWLTFRDTSNSLIKKIKNISKNQLSSFCLPLTSKDKNIGRLRPITFECLNIKSDISLLARWRDAAQEWFPSQFTVTEEGTKTWLEKQVLKQKDRILFMVEDNNHTPLGHVGLFRFDYHHRFCELDNIVRGEINRLPGAMTLACTTLINWAFKELKLKKIYLSVLSNNDRALNLYTRLGFYEVQRVPLMKVEETNGTRWTEVLGNPYHEVKIYFIRMRLLMGEWTNLQEKNDKRRFQ